MMKVSEFKDLDCKLEVLDNKLDDLNIKATMIELVLAVVFGILLYIAVV